MEENLTKYNEDGSELRALQIKMLDILTTVTDIADRHNIPYWISGGTLLGAVRHEGFIPWDDDIDIELLHKDYKRLLSILQQELPPDLYLQTPNQKGYRHLFSKVRDRNSIVHEEDDELDRYNEKGVYIDIFSEERSYRQLKNIVDFFYGRAFRRIKRGRPFFSIHYFMEYMLSVLILFPIGVCLKQFARFICSMTNPPYILHSYGIGNSTCHNAEYMFPLGKIKFEGKTFSCPCQVDTYLTQQYGDYKKIPPADKRVTHIISVEYK